MSLPAWLVITVYLKSGGLVYTQHSISIPQLDMLTCNKTLRDSDVFSLKGYERLYGKDKGTTVRVGCVEGD